MGLYKLAFCMRTTLTLKDLRPGERARVLTCRGSGPAFQRLCEMGFIDGAPIRLVRVAPLGDPIEVELSDYHLSLRKAEAGMIEVEREGPAGG